MQTKLLPMRSFIRTVLFLFTLTFGYQEVKATHIVGGSLTYEHLGGSSYRVRLKLYKDCGPGTFGFPGTVNISVFRGDGTSYGTISIPFTGQDTLDPYIDTCAFNPGVCVSQSVYTRVVNNLYPGNGGYHMVYQLCCRNSSIVNVPVVPFTPGTGTTYHAYIPENFTWLTNSSPDWVNFPPVFVCANNPLVFDHSATDQDGDSLVYSLYRPFEDDAFGWTAGNPATPNFVQTAYNPGYSFLSPLAPSAPVQTMFIDPNTGILTVTPTILGQFVVGVRVEEYRNGQLLSTVYRDFQFNVLNCPPPALAGIGPVDACNGTTIQMINASTSTANGFFWDFGDGNTSTLFAPTHSYAAMGSYTITLYAQYGTPCEHVTTQNINISGTTASFTGPDTICVFTPASFTNTSTSLPGHTVNAWNWSFGNGQSSSLPNPTTQYGLGGDFTVQLIAINSAGCRDTIRKDIYAQPLPTSNAGGDATACETSPLIILNGGATGSTGVLWIGQGGTFDPSSNVLNPEYIPSAAEITAGFSQLILSTAGNGYCPAQSDTIIITYVAGPSVSAGNDIQVCKDTTSIPVSGLITVAGGGEWSSSSGNTNFLPNINSLNATYIPSATDTANGSVMLYLTSILNGNCIASIDSVLISFFDPPTINVQVESPICTGKAASINGNTTTGAGYWVTFGSGSFVPSDTTVVGAYLPSIADENTGSVTLAFYTLNNGGCKQQADTLTITILDSPVPQFNFTQECLNVPTVFTDGSTGPDPIIGWEWQYGDGNTSNAQSPTYTFTTPGAQSVTLVVFSQNGCTDTLTQSIMVNHLPNVSFLNSTPCLNGGSLFIDQTTVIGATITGWNWQFGDGNSSSVQNPLNLYASSGTYTVMLTATSSQGCVNSGSQTTTVLPGPTAAFTESINPVNLFQNINFTDQSTPPPTIVDWEWNFGDGNNSSAQNPAHNYSGTGTFPVMLVVTDVNGCKDTVFRDMLVFMPPQVPNGFSPNGVGANNVFNVLGGPFLELNFRVYNNWGQLIFESNDQAIGWDGTYNNIEQPIGVYVWTVRATTLEGQQHELSGDVTLLR